MALENTTAQYQIEITRTGAGAQQAVAEFQQGGAAAGTANAALASGSANSTAALTTLTATSRGTISGMRALHGVATLVGVQAFPQLGLAAMTVQQGLRAVQAAGVSVTAGLGLTAAGLAGVVAMLTSAVFWWGKYKAEQQEIASGKALDEQTKALGERLREQIEAMRELHEITEKEARALREMTQSLTGQSSVRDFIRELREGSASKSLSDFNLVRANADAQAELLDPRGFNSVGEQKRRALEENVELQKLINQLERDGLMTTEQADAAKIESDTKWMNRLIQIKAQLTDIQILSGQIAQNFAGGLSQAIVDFASGTKDAGEAFKQFAADFMKQTAQMIIQLLIIRALKSVFGSAFGEGGVAVAAQGGMFPRYAANGLSGVQSVSAPTYFPKFNVVAGEAGREMLTVLARPRMMEIGGMEAVVGNAGNNRLAITNADRLQQRGGVVDIRVTLGPELRAEIVNQSVEGARVRVQQDLTQDTPISRGVKGLTG